MLLTAVAHTLPIVATFCCAEQQSLPSYRASLQIHTIYRNIGHFTIQCAAWSFPFTLVALLLHFHFTWLLGMYEDEMATYTTG